MSVERDLSYLQSLLRELPGLLRPAHQTLPEGREAILAALAADLSICTQLGLNSFDSPGLSYEQISVKAQF